MNGTQSSIKQLAAKLHAALVTDKRNDGQEFVHLGDNSPQWMTDVIREIHGDKMPEDTTYAFIERCAQAIEDSESEPQDAIYEIEPDIYTSDLTGWLHARADHVNYVDDAIEEIGRSCIGSFSDLLQAAQSKHIHEVGSALISALEGIA